MKKSKKIVLLLLVIVLLFQANFVFALETIYPKVPGVLTPQEIAEKLKKREIEEEQVPPLYFKYFFSLSLIVVTIICIAVSIYGGVLFLISGGSPVAMVEAKKWVFSGILGLVILFSSYLLLVTINPQLVIFEIPGITKPPPGLPPTPLSFTAEKTYQEIPIGTLVENILAKNIDCYKYSSEGNVEKELKNHDRLDCLKELAEAVRTKSEELKELATRLGVLILRCSCSAPNCVSSCVTPICSGDPCPDRFEINEIREKMWKLVTGDGKGEEFLSIRKGIERLKDAKVLLGKDLNNLVEAENLMKWDCKYGTILNLVKFFNLKEGKEVIGIDIAKEKFKNIDMRKYCIEFNCTEFENEDDPKKKVCIKYELNPEGEPGEGRLCEATTMPTPMEYYVFDGDPATFYCPTGEETTVARLAPVLLKTCAEQGGIPCNPGQICEDGYFSGSSDYGVSAGKFTWAGTKLVYGWHDRFNVDQILAAGFNTVVTYRILDASDKSFLDESLQKGLWVLPTIKDFFPNPWNDYTLNVQGAIDFINRWKGHAAIGAWYFLDEPELHGYTKAEQENWYNILKATDPSRDFLTTFTTNPVQGGVDYFNPNAFDHVGVDLYPINDESFRYGPGEWNGNWQGYMDYSLNRWNSLTGGIGGIAIVQAYYAPESGILNPSGYIEGMLKSFQEHGAGTQKDGYGMYAWGGTDGTYLPQDSAVLSEVTSVNAGYSWSHVSPQRGEGITEGEALCCVGGTCKSTP